MTLLQKLYFKLFVWTGSKLFSLVVFTEGDPITVVHFAHSEAELRASCLQLSLPDDIKHSVEKLNEPRTMALSDERLDGNVKPN